MPGDTQKKTKTETPAFRITDDWLEDMPITKAELELFKAHMLDMVATMVQHG